MADTLLPPVYVPRPCIECGHVHRVQEHDYARGNHLIYDERCAICGCVANGRRYGS